MSYDVTLGVFVKLSNVHLFGACLNTPNTFSKTVSRAAHPNLHSGRLRPLLQVAAIRGPRRKYFRWGKDVRPRKLDETLNRHGRRARRVALLAPSGSPPKVFSVGQSERRSVSTVRRLVMWGARLKLFSRGVFIKARLRLYEKVSPAF